MAKVPAKSGESGTKRTPNKAKRAAGARSKSSAGAATRSDAGGKRAQRKLNNGASKSSCSKTGSTRRVAKPGVTEAERVRRANASLARALEALLNAAVLPEAAARAAIQTDTALNSLAKAIDALGQGQRLISPRQLGLEDLPLPVELLRAAPEALRRQCRGESPHIAVQGELLRPAEAAELLGVSRPHLNMLLDRERISYSKTQGGHRRILRSDLQTYTERQDAAHRLMATAASLEADLADDD